MYIKLEIAGKMPVMVRSVYNTNNVNTGQFLGRESRSVVNFGIYLHSGGAGAVPEMDFEKSQM